jgi:hypothetical protein
MIWQKSTGQAIKTPKKAVVKFTLTALFEALIAIEAAAETTKTMENRGWNERRTLPDHLFLKLWILSSVNIQSYRNGIHRQVRGKRNVLFRNDRFSRGRARGLWARELLTLQKQAEAGFQKVIIDSTMMKVRRHGAKGMTAISPPVSERE